MAELLDPTIENRFDVLKSTLKSFKTLLSDASEEDVEGMREDIANTQGFLEDVYTTILNDAEEEGIVWDAAEHEELEQKRKQTREVLRQVRQILQARWDYDYQNANLEAENGVEENSNNANTVMGGNNERRRRSRKQAGGKRRKTRKSKRSEKKRKRSTRKH